MIILHLPVCSKALGSLEINAGIPSHARELNQSGRTRSRSRPIMQFPIARTWASTLALYIISCNGDHWWEIADFRGYFKWIKSVHLFCKCETIWRSSLTTIFTLPIHLRTHRVWRPRWLQNFVKIVTFSCPCEGSPFTRSIRCLGICSPHTEHAQGPLLTWFNFNTSKGK